MKSGELEGWHADCDTQLALANRLGFDVASVCRGNKTGELSIEGLIHILVRSCRGWADLPPLPSAAERIKAGTEGVRECLKLNEDEIECLWCMSFYIDDWKTYQVLYEEHADNDEQREARLRTLRLYDLPDEIIDMATKRLGRDVALRDQRCLDREALIHDLLELDQHTWRDFQEAMPWLDNPDWEEA